MAQLKPPGSARFPRSSLLGRAWTHRDLRKASDLRPAFELQTWVDAYNTAHPDAPICLNQ